MAEEINFENRHFWNFKSHVTLTLTSDDESGIVVNDSSTLMNTTIWFVAALCLIVDVWTYVWTDLWTDIFTRFIRSSLRRWPNEVTLQQAEMRIMIRWMCGMKLQDRVPSKGLRWRLGLVDIILVLQQNRLRWYWHVVCSIYVPDSLFPQSLSFLWSTSWPGTLNFIHFKIKIKTATHKAVQQCLVWWIWLKTETFIQ